MRFNKATLLEYGIFVDNQFLDKYISLINNCEVNYIKYETARHHVIPRCYYKRNHIDIDNTASNVVRLYHKDHALAHYYLYYCLNDTYLRWSAAYSVQFTLGEKYFIDSPNYEQEASFIRQLDGYQEMVADSFRRNALDRGVRERCSRAAKERWSSEVERAKQRDRLLGKVWVHNETERTLIDRTELDSYLNAGYVTGSGYSPTSSVREAIRSKLKGHKPTQEQIDKIIASRAGYTHSEETRKKISQARMGKPGQPKTEEMKKHLSDVLKGKCITGNIVECIETGERYISITSAASCLSIPNDVLIKSSREGIGICGLHYKIYSSEESKRIFSEESKDSFISIVKDRPTYSTKSYIFMNKNNVGTRVPPNRVQDYILDGWSIGKLPLSEESRARRKELYKDKVIHKSGVKVMCIENGSMYISKAQASKETGVSVYKIQMSIDTGVSYDGYTFRRVE